LCERREEMTGNSCHVHWMFGNVTSVRY
jgi:hypothetical protein